MSLPEKREHVKQAEQMQAEQFCSMSPAERLNIAMSLYEVAWSMKAAGLRRGHPDWSEERVQSQTRRIFLTGYAGI